MSEKTLMAIAVAAELTGTELSKAALLAMEADLAQFPESMVLNALTRCRKELTGRLTLAAILDRVNERDGRPSSDEAWAQAITAHDEAESVVWTKETAMAFNAARGLLDIGDKVGARMAFKDTYDRIVSEAREAGQPVEWQASLGWDAERRRDVLLKAVELGKLPESFAVGLLPAPTDCGPVMGALMNGGSFPRLAYSGDVVDPENVREKVKRAMSALRNGKVA